MPLTPIAFGLLVLGTVIAKAASSGNDDDRSPLPRPQRQRRRPMEDMGLPPDDELTKLADFYLTKAAQLWPEMAKAGLLPKPAAGVLQEMVDDFKVRHRTGKVNPKLLESFRKLVKKFGVAYPRYSDDNSDPKSIVDQMREILEGAKAQSRFIPWTYLFADYARSALHGRRQGYDSLMKIIKSKDHSVETVFIHEFMRGNRNEDEAWKLAGTCKRLNVRLVGVSDSFNLDSGDWDTQVRFYNLFTHMETKYKRIRVRRGMRGAAMENRSLGKMPLGYTRRAKLDANGGIIRGSDDKPVYERCIDPVTRKDA